MLQPNVPQLAYNTHY